MEPRTLTSIAGFILIIAGLGLLVAQIVWPDHFLDLHKQWQGLGIKFNTNAIGFGVLGVGAALLAAATIRAPRHR
jgi:hypothetical protein